MQSSYRPWHRPLVGIIMLLLCSVGVYDFLMIHMGNEAYMSSIQSTGNIVAYFSDYPIPLSIIWGVNVFAGF